MLVTSRPRRTVWEEVLPPGYQQLPVELAWVDAMLDDPQFFAPYRKHFSATLGRPSIPIETYLRMMYLLRQDRHKRYYADRAVMPTRVRVGGVRPAQTR
jgi:hypothetical protein